jgi:transposase, IS5 family
LAFDVVMMFKIIVLQRYYVISDAQVEYQIIDRTSFKNFLRLDTGDTPDQNAIWAFRVFGLFKK